MLGELHDLAFLFPFLRPKDVFIDEFAWRVVAGMEEPRDTSGLEAAEGADLLPAEERARIVRSWAGRYPNRWAGICRHVGDPELAETTAVASAVRGAVADRIGPLHELVALIEGSLEQPPLPAVAIVIPSETVWTYEEMLAGSFIPTRAHLARTRTQIRRLSAWLPVENMSRASATLQKGCELADDDDRLVRRVAGFLLGKYQFAHESRASDVSLTN